MPEYQGYGYRHQQCLIVLTCLITLYSMRSCIGVAMVAMVEIPDEIATHNHTIMSEQIYNLSYATLLNSTTDNFRYIKKPSSDTEENKIGSNGGILNYLLLRPPYPKFKWSQKTKEMVISSFFWGYVSLQIPAGQLSHRFGPRWLLTGALIINSIFSFCFPWAVYYGGWIFGAACRTTQGMSQACLYPSMYGFFGQWTPPEERSRLMGVTLSGMVLGIILGLPISGFIAASPLGWPGIFRFYGTLSGFVAILVYLMITDTPALHPKISLAERKYIEEKLNLKKGQKKKGMPIPWRSIFGCRAFYFAILAHIAVSWVEITLFTQLPAFVSSILHVNIQSNGLLLALPYAVMWCMSFFFNWFTDWIIVKKYLNITNARKMATTIGLTPAAIFLVVLAYAPKTIVMVESLLVVICALKISTFSGSMISFVDLAPNFADTLMSISNFCANLVGSQAPIAVSLFVTDEKSEEQWRNVFILAAGLCFFSNLAYCIFGSAEKVPWNDPINKEEDPENAKEIEPMIKEDKKKNEAELNHDFEE